MNKLEEILLNKQYSAIYTADNKFYKLTEINENKEYVCLFTNNLYSVENEKCTRMDKEIKNGTEKCIFLIENPLIPDVYLSEYHPQVQFISGIELVEFTKKESDRIYYDIFSGKRLKQFNNEPFVIELYSDNNRFINNTNNNTFMTLNNNGNKSRYLYLPKYNQYHIPGIENSEIKPSLSFFVYLYDVISGSYCLWDAKKEHLVILEEEKVNRRNELLCGVLINNKRSAYFDRNFVIRTNLPDKINFNRYRYTLTNRILLDYDKVENDILVNYEENRIEAKSRKNIFTILCGYNDKYYSTLLNNIFIKINRTILYVWNYKTDSIIPLRSAPSFIDIISGTRFNLGNLEFDKTPHILLRRINRNEYISFNDLNIKVVQKKYICSENPIYKTYSLNKKRVETDCSVLFSNALLYESNVLFRDFDQARFLTNISLDNKIFTLGLDFLPEWFRNIPVTKHPRGIRVTETDIPNIFAIPNTRIRIQCL